MIGAIIGDIVGSKYEFNNIKTKDFPLFSKGCSFTDDTVLTIAVADWLLDGGDLAERLVAYGRKYPHLSYGGMFGRWLSGGSREPYNSFGNGSAMRVSAVAWVASDEAEVMALAKASAEVTHSHPEGIKGAQATALAIWMALQCAHSNDIKTTITECFGYDLTESVDSIRTWYRFDESCEGTVPQAIICALGAMNFEDAIRNAVSIGGDSDTVAAITGGIAEAKFGVPKAIEEKARSYLSEELDEIVSRFFERVGRNTNTELDAKKRQVSRWLADNVTVICKVQSVVLSKFTWNPERYGGEFHVTFDGVKYPRSFNFSLGGIDGHTDIYTPMFTSPLGVPASFAAIEIPSSVMKLVNHEIRTLFPRIEPYGVNRRTGKDTHSSTPIHERLPDPAALLKAVEAIINPEFEIVIDVASSRDK
jgi:ADP-ribosylglycohydrolase